MVRQTLAYMGGSLRALPGCAGRMAHTLTVHDPFCSTAGPGRPIRPHLVGDLIKPKETQMTLLHPGDPFPALTVNLVGGGTLQLPDALTSYFGVVLFYRGSWCTYRNA
jgi:hypothetical protein